MRVPEHDETSCRALLADGWRDVGTLDMWCLPTNAPTIPNGGVKVRRYRKGDEQACLWLFMSQNAPTRLRNDKALGDDMVAALTRQWVANALGNDTYHRFVAVEDGHARGFIIGNRDGHKIVFFAVHPLAKRKGLGSALVARLAREYENWSLMAGVYRNNIEAGHFYRAAGFISMSDTGEYSGLRTFHK